jgi:CPA1 family monovalent cation:H+ antiporter
MEQFLNTETLIIELLLIASLVALAVHRLRIPYTVALVVVGLLITFQQPLQLNLTPEVILALFVPPLVFEAAFHINFAELQRNLSPVLLLAVPGVILTTLIVGLVVASGTALDLPTAFVFGALMAATDPVAVVAVFRAIGVPKRLAILIEGESLLNDGTAIVLFNLALAAALTGSYNPIQGVADFVRVSAGGIITGLALGWVISRLIARVDDYLIETTLTTVLAFGSYLLAERLSFSGVLAVVAAGLVNGNLGPQGMSPTTRIVLFSFWEYVAFLANSLVFLLIGLQVNVPALVAQWQPVVWAIAAVLASRVVVVYGLGWIANRWVEPIPAAWQHVITWSGLRGAISLALALSLPTALGPDRDLLRVMAFGVVLFTLLAQGTTMGPLVRFLRVVTRRESETEYELRHARVTALRAAERHLENQVKQGMVSGHAWHVLKPELEERTASLANAVHEVLVANPELEAEEMRYARQELLRAQRGALLGLRRDGVISDEVLDKLSGEVDAELERLKESLEGAGTASTEPEANDQT